MARAAKSDTRDGFRIPIDLAENLRPLFDERYHVEGFDRGLSEIPQDFAPSLVAALTFLWGIGKHYRIDVGVDAIRRDDAQNGLRLDWVIAGERPIPLGALQELEIVSWFFSHRTGPDRVRF